MKTKFIQKPLSKDKLLKRITKLEKALVFLDIAEEQLSNNMCAAFRGLQKAKNLVK